MLSKTNKFYPYVFISSLTVLVFFIIKFSPGLFSLMEPDSYDYLKIVNSNTRTSIYPGLNEVFSFLNLNIINFQVFFLSLSISFLIFSIYKKTNNFLILLITFFLLSFNYYYTSFSKTILTESFFFSFINFAISILLLVKNYKKLHILFLGIFLGLIITIKPIGLTFAIPIILFFFIKSKSSLKLILIAPIIFIISIENYFFYLFHEKRSSVLPVAMTGKIFMISGHDNFDYKVFPTEYHSLLKNVQKKSKEVNIFLKSIDNALLKIDLTADFEAVFQTQLRNMIKVNEITFIKFQEDKNNFYICLKNNIGSYFKISSFYYLGQWLTGPKYIFLDKYNFKNENAIPLYDNLILSSSEFNKPNIIHLYASLLFFLILFILFSLISLGNFYIDLRKKSLGLQSLIIISVQAYLIATSFINISSIRYLMPIYPLVILIIIIFVYEQLNKYKNKKMSLENKN